MVAAMALPGLALLPAVALLVVALCELVTASPESLSDQAANDLGPALSSLLHLALYGPFGRVLNVNPDLSAKLVFGRDRGATSAASGFFRHGVRGAFTECVKIDKQSGKYFGLTPKHY